HAGVRAAQVVAILAPTEAVAVEAGLLQGDQGIQVAGGGGTDGGEGRRGHARNVGKSGAEKQCRHLRGASRGTTLRVAGGEAPAVCRKTGAFPCRGDMSQLVIVVEKASDWRAYHPSENVVEARDYLRADVGGERHVQVINLCRNYRYLGTGYYVSLLAEARGHRVIPSVRTINALSRRSLYTVDVDDLNRRLSRFVPVGGPVTTRLEVLSCFGRTPHPVLCDLTRRIFETFPCPLMRIEFRREREWRIGAIRTVGLDTLDEAEEDLFAEALDGFSRKLWRKPRPRQTYRYDLAMLVDPEEAMPPSNRRALKAFVGAGRQLGIDVDLV